ncbi:MAG: 50S ribosomal protein L6 [Dehalococcoidia bacterium]|nr:MAG: 50S ribosomal protein L6 [Dehalococcoidia bacterium]
MSRIGKSPINVPQGVVVIIKGSRVTVTGPKGELNRTFSPDMKIQLDGDVLTVNRPSDGRQHRSLHGLTRTLLANMVLGVSQGFKKELEVIGVGYKAEKSDDKLVLRVGYSHLVEMIPPPGIEIELQGTNKIMVKGVNKETVGQMAAEIRAIRPPDAYKGKGIRYAGEVVRLKPGKAGKAIGGTA